MNKDHFLKKTLDRLKSLYQQEGLDYGILEKVGLKPGWNAVIGSKGQCGMAMSFAGFNNAFGEPVIDMEKIQSFIGKSLLETAETFIESTSWQERAVGVASMSAISMPLLQPDSLKKRGWDVSENGHFSGLIQPDDITAVVGYGGGIQGMLGKCRELHATDMRPRNAFQGILISNTIEYTPKEVHVHPEEDNRSVLSNATVVIITGSSLVNGTFEELMSYAKNARLIVAYGASVGLIPEVFFEEGVNFIHSYRLKDPAAFEKGMLNDMNMEGVVKSTQGFQAISRVK